MTGEIRLVRTIRASRAAIWQACHTSRGLAGWYADRVTGHPERGGVVHLEWPDLGAKVDLDVVELEPETRIAFHNGESRVTLTVTEGCLELTHGGLGSRDDIEGFESSWRIALAHLAHGLERHPGRDRRTAWFAGRARARPELAHFCFTEPEALASWLGRGTLGGEGSSCALALEEGCTMTGRVLVRAPGRDVALSWSEEGDSVLALRCLPSPRSDEERIVALCWSNWGERPADGAEEEATRARLASSLERLLALLSRTGTA